MPRQIIPIPPDRAGDFDFTVDLAIRPNHSFDDSRVWTRLRVPLATVLEAEVGAEDEAGHQSSGRSKLVSMIENAIGNVLEQGLVIPGGRDGARDGS